MKTLCFALFVVGFMQSQLNAQVPTNGLAAFYLFNGGARTTENDRGKYGITQNTIYTEGFESYADGSFPNGGGWILRNGSSNSTSNIVKAGFSHSGNKSFLVSARTVGTTVVYTHLPSTPKVVYAEYWMMVPSGSNGSGGAGFNNSSEHANGKDYGNGCLHLSGKIQLSGNGVTRYYQTFNRDQWYKFRLKCDYKVNTISLWVDGVLLEDALSAPFSSVGYQDFWLNGDASSQEWYIDDINIYTEDSTVPTNGLVAYYPFNGNANDESGNNRHGSVTNAALTLDRFGRHNKAYQFSEPSSHIQVNSFPAFNSTFSVSTWINSTGTSSQNQNFSCFGTVNGGLASWDIAYNHMGGQFALFDILNGVMNHPEVVLNVWKHVCFVYSGTERKLYVDGILKKTGTVTTPFTTKPTDVYRIGRHTNNSQQFEGAIDDIRIYNRALSQSEITALFTEQSLPFAPPSNLIGTPLGTDRIKLQWQDNSTTEDRFEIQRSLDGFVWNPLQTTGSDVTDYEDAGLQPNTKYWYRVRAGKDATTTAWSNEASATTLKDNSLPPPYNVKTRVDAYNVANVLWSYDPAIQEDGFEIQRSEQGTGSGFSTRHMSISGARGYRDTTVTAKTDYWYRLRAFKGADTSHWSEVIHLQTPENPDAIRLTYLMDEKSLLVAKMENLLTDNLGILGEIIKIMGPYSPGYKEGTAKDLIQRWRTIQPAHMAKAADGFERLLLAENAMHSCFNNPQDMYPVPGAKEVSREIVSAFKSLISNAIAAFDLRRDISEDLGIPDMFKGPIDAFLGDLIDYFFDTIELMAAIVNLETDLGIPRLATSIATKGIKENVVEIVLEGVAPYVQDRIVADCYFPKTQQNIFDCVTKTENNTYFGSYAEAREKVEHFVNKARNETTDLQTQYSWFEGISKVADISKDLVSLGGSSFIDLLPALAAMKFKLIVTIGQLIGNLGIVTTRYQYLVGYNPFGISLVNDVFNANVAAFKPSHNGLTAGNPIQLRKAMNNDIVSSDTSAVARDRILLLTVQDRLMIDDTSYIHGHMSDVSRIGKQAQEMFQQISKPLLGIPVEMILADTIYQGLHNGLFGDIATYNGRRSMLALPLIMYLMSPTNESKTAAIAEIDTVLTLATSLKSKILDHIAQNGYRITNPVLTVLSVNLIPTGTPDVYDIRFEIKNVGGADANPGKMNLEIAADSVVMMNLLPLYVSKIEKGKSRSVTAKAALKHSQPDILCSISISIDSLIGIMQDRVYLRTGNSNRPPKITINQTEFVIHENEKLTIPLDATDNDFDPISISMPNLPIGAVLTELQGTKTEFQWTPSFDDAGRYENRLLIASDGIAADTVRFSITVLNVNRAPDTFQLLSPINHAVVSLNGTSPVDFLWTRSNDPDKEDTVRYHLTVIGPGMNREWRSMYDTTASLAIRASLQELSTYTWTVTASDGAANVSKTDTFTTSKIVSVSQLPIPNTATLEQNYPNPFNPTTTIGYFLPTSSIIRLRVFDIYGREVALLVDGERQAGRHDVVFDGRNLPSGTYFYRLEVGSSKQTRAMLLLR